MQVVEGVVDDVESRLHVFEVDGLESDVHGASGGAQPDAGARVFHGIGEDDGGLEHESAQLGVGDLGGLGAKVLEWLGAGGWAWGLDAAGGGRRFLEEKGGGLEFGGQRIPLVPAAILFDLGIGRADRRPDAEAGYRAAKAAKRGAVAQGSVGAGTGATVAKAGGADRRLKGGLGTSCEKGVAGLLAGAIVAVNAGGDIIDPDRGAVIAGPRADEAGAFLNGWELVRDGVEPIAGNTTLAILATNADLTKEQANRLASVAQDGFARTVRPAHGR